MKNKTSNKNEYIDDGHKIYDMDVDGLPNRIKKEHRLGGVLFCNQTLRTGPFGPLKRTPNGVLLWDVEDAVPYVHRIGAKKPPLSSEHTATKSLPLSSRGGGCEADG